MDELLETGLEVAEKDHLYRCLDRVLEHNQELFVYLKQKWAGRFGADFEVLLYDLTSTYFEGEMEQNPKARRSYSRDGRPDCLQLVIALVVTPDGFPLAYEVMNGNTADNSTLRDFLAKIETTYGKARRVWVMDRGIPSEAILNEMHQPKRETFYLVGMPKGRISQHEKKWLDLPWRKVRDSVEVKLYQHEGELYVLANGSGRQAREIAMRRRRLARLLRNLTGEDPAVLWTRYVKLTQIESVFRSLKSDTSSSRPPIIRPSSGPNRRADSSALTSAITSDTKRVAKPRAA